MVFSSFPASGGSRWSCATLRRQSEDIPISSPEDFMSTRTTDTRDDALGNGARSAPHRARRLSTETKAAFKTTEFFAFIAMLVGVLIAGAVIDQADAGGLGARQVWLYATVLTVGYMISRGLAKSGSRDPYDAEDR
jgi:hypothetical protein